MSRLFLIFSRRPVRVPRSGRVPRARCVPRTSRVPRTVRVPCTSRVSRTSRLPRTGRLPRTSRRHVLLQRQHLAPSRCGGQRPHLRTSSSSVLPPSLNGRHDGKLKRNDG